MFLSLTKDLNLQNCRWFQHLEREQLHNLKMSKITNMRKVKQDDKFSLAVREIQTQHPANKKCFDCEQRGPTYLNMTIGSFVCTKCSGMLRGEQRY